MIKTNNLEDLVNKNGAESLLLKHRQECGLEGDFNVENIFRHRVLSSQTYALSYEVQNGQTKRNIRLNASSEETRERAFAVMQYLEPLFAGPQFFIPKPYFYDLDYNAVSYANIQGELLINQLNDPNLVDHIKLVSLWLKKLHQIEKPNLQLPTHQVFFNFEALKKFYPDLARKGPQLVEQLKSQISFDFKETLIHGDYQPNNIIIVDDKVTVFDFNDSQLDDPTLDLAKFVSQLKVMLFRFGDVRKFEDLKKIFLETYGNKFNHNNFCLHLKLYYLQILCSLSASLANDPEAQKTIPEIYKYWEDENRT